MNRSVLTGLDFIQSGMRDVSTHLALALATTSNQALNNGICTILWGCIKSGSNISVGAVYYNGEVYFVPAGAITGSVTSYIGAGAIANPTDAVTQTEMSDGSLVSVHDQRTISFQYNASADQGLIGNAEQVQNLPDFGEWQGSIVTVPVGVAATLGTGFGPGNSVRYFLENNGRVSISGVFACSSYSQSTLFTLPSSCFPKSGYNVTGTWFDYTGNAMGSVVIVGGTGAVVINGMSTAQDGHQINLSFPSYFALI